MNSFANNSKQNGFTLLEIIVAMAIAALIGVGAMELLNSATTAHKNIQEQGERFNQIERAFLFLSNDIQQLAPRNFRDEFGDVKNNLTSDDSIGKTHLSFTRLGRRNPAQLPRSNLEKLTYLVDDVPPDYLKNDPVLKSNWLKRISYAFPDGMTEDQGLARVLLDDVESIKAEFFDGEEWTDYWPVDDGQTLSPSSSVNLPVAVKISLELKDLGIVERIYLVSDKREPSGQNGGPGGKI